MSKLEELWIVLLLPLLSNLSLTIIINKIKWSINLVNLLILNIKINLFWALK